MENINAYEYLEISEDAKEQEIRAALINQLNKYCNNDSTDSEYLREIFTQSADLLLNPKTRLKIDKERQLRKVFEEIEDDISLHSNINSEQEGDNNKDEINKIYGIAEPSKANKILISSINTELLSKILVLSKQPQFGKKLYLNLLYGVFGEDNSFTFAKEGINFQDSKWYLKSITDRNKIIQSYETIWEQEQNFFSNGIKYIPIKAGKIIPDEMKFDGKVYQHELTAVTTAIKKYISSNPEIISQVFSEENIHKQKIKK